MRPLFAFGLIYKDVAKPLFFFSVVLQIYVEGSVNGIEDYCKKTKKSFATNIMNMGKGAAKGAIIGATFPISVPLWLLYIKLS